MTEANRELSASVAKLTEEVEESADAIAKLNAQLAAAHQAAAEANAQQKLQLATLQAHEKVRGGGQDITHAGEDARSWRKSHPLSFLKQVPLRPSVSHAGAEVQP